MKSIREKIRRIACCAHFPCPEPGTIEQKGTVPKQNGSDSEMLINSGGEITIRPYHTSPNQSAESEEDIYVPPQDLRTFQPSQYQPSNQSLGETLSDNVFDDEPYV